jgi:hypothetical protein
MQTQALPPSSSKLPFAPHRGPKIDCLSLCCLALLLTGAVVPANATAITGYYVITDSKSVATNNVDTEGSVEMVYNTTNGSTTSITNIGATLTNSGSPNVLGLTSSFDQTSAAVGTFTSASYAAADLSTGWLKASVSNVGDGPFSSSQAAFSDTLTFAIPGATSTTVTDVGIHYVVHGSFDTDRGSVDLPLLFGSAQVDPQWFATQAPSFHFNFGWVSETVNTLDTQDFDFTGFIAVTGANPVVQLSAALNLDCSGIVSCDTDFSHTGTISLVLPGGTTYSSASGVFLTNQSTSAAPEPGTLFLLGLGLAGIALARNRGRAN